MQDRRAAEPIEPDAQDVVGGPAGVELQRVSPTVSVQLFDGSGSVAAVAAGREGPRLDLLWAAIRHPRVPFLGTAFAFAVGAAIFLVSGDPNAGVMGATLTWLAVSRRTLDRHFPFSFGEGFIGYRGDPPWPRGVQEDDDVRWDWRPHRVATSGDGAGTGGAS